MALNAKVLFVAVLALGVVSKGFAHVDAQDEKYYTIKKMEVRQISTDVLGIETSELIQAKSFASPDGVEGDIKQVDPIERAGKVISVARDLVALGEDIYKLVVKGKPTNLTQYAPISVIPKVSGQPVDLMETESWRMPIKRTYSVIYENLYGVDVVTFRYSVIYSYGGSYDGKGAYLTAVQIVPESVRTLWGFDFTATMKLGGIQNQGTRSNPVAGATILMEYTVSNILNAQNSVDSYFITGNGGFKKL